MIGLEASGTNAATREGERGTNLKGGGGGGGGLLNEKKAKKGGGGGGGCLKLIQKRATPRSFRGNFNKKEK